VDTRRASTAARALELGADLINDVSGLADPEMPAFLASSRCDYVLMHSLSVPAGGPASG
jgi:dihydropteroate synthase